LFFQPPLNSGIVFRKRRRKHIKDMVLLHTTIVFIVMAKKKF
jgi:hypothetical protein